MSFPGTTWVAGEREAEASAVEYHQDYYVKNPLRYKLYRYNCGRDQRLEQLWGKKAE